MDSRPVGTETPTGSTSVAAAGWTPKGATATNGSASPKGAAAKSVATPAAGAAVVAAAPAAKSPPSPGFAPKVKATEAARHWWTNWVLWTSVAGVVLLAAGGMFAYKMFRTPEPPRMSDPPATLATFFDSPAFDSLPFDRRVAFMKQLDDRQDALVEAYRNRNLSDADYRKGLQGAYLGRQLTRMKNYFQEPAGRARTLYVDRQFEKKHAEKKGAAVVKKDGSKKQAKPSLKDADDVKEIKRDDSREAEQVAKWPTDVQNQWKQYHAAVEERKRVWEDKKRDAWLKADEAKAATAPADGGK